MTSRNLSLTEELEKLEQSITLTLQEIDRNFSKAHTIVTTSILPRVEQYGEHSKAVWEATKFWKHFFEASANVSLSGYEDQADVKAQGEGEEEDDAISVDFTADLDEEERSRVSAAGDGPLPGEESLLEDADLAGGTPRLPTAKPRADRTIAESPYETMKREMRGEENDTTVLDEDGDDDDEDEDEDSTLLFAQQRARLTGLSMTPRGILQARDKDAPDQRPRDKDPVLHHMLDKTYRVQATPHKSALRMPPAKGKQPERERTGTLRWQDSPMSSPEIAIPKLRSEAFMSPLKGVSRGRSAAAAAAAAAAQAQAQAQAPRTPGVSVQTPAAGRRTRDVFARESAGKTGGRTYELDWESEEDDGDLYGGMSPPKTIQFALPPSKLMQTPAREASRRIVGDILLDAGAESPEYSPTMVKMNEDILDDTF